MKKGLLIFLGVIVFLIAALAILPFFFKDEINAKLKTEIANSVDAKVNFDDLSLSFFRNFPNLSISLDKLAMTGVKPGFNGDTLFSADNFNITVDVMSVISGDQIKVKGIYLDKPYILTKFLKDGRMSWDVAKAAPEDTTTKAPEEPGSFSLGIEKWQLKDATIIYDDQSMPMYTELRHLNHDGSGEMVGDIFKILESKTTSPEFFFSFDNVTYLNKHSLDADVKFNMDLKNSVYTFIDNVYKLNDFKMKFGGSIAMPADGIDMDLKFSADETEFKHLISLIPAIYTKDFEHIKTDGKIAFDGWYKGTMNETQMPGFGVNLLVGDAMMQYPDLTPVTNIGVDLKVVCTDGNTDNMIIDLKKFNMDMGKNPVRATALVKGLGPMDVDARVKATLNLADVNKMYPVEGTTLAGIFNLDLTAKGVYDDAKKLMPMVNADMRLANGSVKSKDVPFPLENINVHSIAKSNGDMKTTSVFVEGFKMILDGEPFEMKALVENFDDMRYDVNIKGIVDLTKMTKIYPLEGMTLAGRINADISTKGVMSDVDAGRYNKTQTSGSMGVKDFKYVSVDMPQGMSLSSANFTLTPDKMTIVNMDGFAGRSDISVKGYFSNYMGYAFGDENTKDTVIHGYMSLGSKKFDVNEWMPAEEEAAAVDTAADEPLTVFEVPKDIDFHFASNMNKVLYDSLILTDMTGNIVMKDGILRMDKINFNSLGGNFLMNAGYNTQNMKDPKYDMDMKIDNLELKEAYKSFEMIRKFAPIAGNMDGKFHLDIATNGSLGQDMMPVYKTVNGSGKALIANAQVKDNKALAGIAAVTQVKNLNPMAIKDLAVKFKIVDGNVEVDPFDVNAGNIKMNVSGKQSLEGNLDYKIKMDVPAGAVGSAVNNQLASLTGKPASGNDNIKLDLKVGGTYKDPKVGLAGSSMKEQAKDAVKDAVADKLNDEKDKAKADAEAKLKAEADKAKADAEAKLKAEQDRLKKEADDKAKAEAARLKKEAEDKAKNLLKKKW